MLPVLLPMCRPSAVYPLLRRPRLQQGSAGFGLLELCGPSHHKSRSPSVDGLRYLLRQQTAACGRLERTS